MAIEDREWGQLLADVGYIRENVADIKKTVKLNCDRIEKLEVIYSLLKWIGTSLIAVIIISVVIAVVMRELGL